MVALSSFYAIISRVAAVVLLCAGVLKAQEYLSSPGVDPQWTVLGQTAGELLLGLWLLVGLHPRWSRIIALVCFVVFLNVALAGAVRGQASCGCFGKLSVRPWSAVGLDALLVVGLLFSPTTQMREFSLRAKRIRWFGFIISAFMVLLVVGWPLVRNVGLAEKHIPSIAGEVMPKGIDKSALDRVIHDVEQNHAALHTLVCTTEKVATQHPAKWTGTRRIRKGNEWIEETGTWIVPDKEYRSRHVTKTWIRGDEVREESLAHYKGDPGEEILDLSAGEILISSKGKRIQYAPNIHQAWVSRADFADGGLATSIDPRCAGFKPPLKSIADWLKNRCKILNAGLTTDKAGREVIRVRARGKIDNKTECEVIADFVTAMNCMPSRVVYYFLPDGGVFTVTDIEYQQVGPNSAWLPRRIVWRSFHPDTTSDPEVPNGQNLSVESTMRVLAFGQGVEDEDFDPQLPESTLVMGNLAAQNKTGKAPIRTSKLTRTEPGAVTADSTRLSQAGAVSTRALSFAAGMDVLLLGFCLVFRKRLAF